MRTRTTAVITTAVLGIAAGLGLASPAEAATGSLPCNSGSTNYLVRTITVGETLEITAPGCTGFSLPAQAAGRVVYGGVTYLPGQSGSYTGGTVTYLPPDATMRGSFELGFTNGGTGVGETRITVTAPDYPARPWFQSIGRAAGATCPSGWDASWAQWPNGGAGGFTCNRFVPDQPSRPYASVTGNPQGVG